MNKREGRAALSEEDRIRIAIKEQEERNRAARHSYQNVHIRSAVRILMGGFSCGDVDEEMTRNALESLKEVQRMYWPEAGRVHLDTERYIEESRTDRELLLDRKKGRSLAETLGDRRILLIDDEYVRVGWDIVFDALFGRNHVEYRAEVDEAKGFIEEYGDELSLVLLDLRLPDEFGAAPHADVGLELLSEIKKSHLELPVVICSGVDEVQYARKCFGAGATDYFVKELEEEKASLPYYQKFKEVVSDSLSHPEWREIWKRVRDLPRHGRRKAVFDQVKSYLHKGYYFLTTDEDDPRVKLILTEERPSVHSECIFQCVLATESIIEEEFRKRIKNLRKRNPELKGLPYNQIDRKIPIRSEKGRSKVNILHEKGKLTEDQVSQFSKIYDQRRAHPGIIRESPEELAKTALEVFESTLDFLEAYFP